MKSPLLDVSSQALFFRSFHGILGRTSRQFFLAVLCLNLGTAFGESLELHTRGCVRSGSNQWVTVEKTVRWEPQRTAIVICDMWNQHWCHGATARVAEMAPRMNDVLTAARNRGVLIIHCPSDTMKYYENFPQRKVAKEAPKIAEPAELAKWGGLEPAREGALPIDDSDGGCDDQPQCKTGGPWTHEIDTLEIKDNDAITDSAEAYYLMTQRGITNLIVMGVHGNMCVLGRPFSIRQMVHRGENVLFMRDLIDTMYNSRKPPFVSHFAGTDLLTEQIEKYWCPSITSADLLGGAPFHFRDDKRPHVVFIVGENEYHTWETLPEFARHELVKRGLRCSFVEANPEPGDNNFRDYALLKEADLVLISVRRRTPPREMMALLRAYLDAGKPLVGIRTASHAFAAEPPDNQHSSWPTFDKEVLGCNYQGHYENVEPNGAPTVIEPIGQVAAHPILSGVPTNQYQVTSSLYKSRKPGTEVVSLMSGHVQGQTETEPVAWVNTAKHRRVFYTSLGSPADFQQAFFRRLLVNGIFWSLNQAVPSE